MWKCNNQPISLLPVLSKVNERLAHRQFVRLCIKVGQGQGDGDMGTRVGIWDFGMRVEGLRDIKYGTRGHVGWGRGDVKNRDAGDANDYHKSQR